MSLSGNVSLAGLLLALFLAWPAASTSVFASPQDPTGSPTPTADPSPAPSPMPDESPAPAADPAPQVAADDLDEWFKDYWLRLMEEIINRPGAGPMIDDNGYRYVLGFDGDESPRPLTVFNLPGLYGQLLPDNGGMILWFGDGALLFDGEEILYMGWWGIESISWGNP